MAKAMEKAMSCSATFWIRKHFQLTCSWVSAALRLCASLRGYWLESSSSSIFGSYTRMPLKNGGTPRPWWKFFLRTNEKMELEKKNNSKISKILLKLIVARNSFSSLTNLFRKSKKLDQLISLLWDRFWIFNWFMSKIEWTQQRRGALIFILSDCDWSYIWLWLVWIDFLFIVIDLNWCLLNSIEF